MKTWFDPRDVDWRFEPPLRLRRGLFGGPQERLLPRREAIGERYIQHVEPLVEKLSKIQFQSQHGVESSRSDSARDLQNSVFQYTWPKTANMIHWDEPEADPPPFAIADMDAFARVAVSYAAMSLRRRSNPEFRWILTCIEEWAKGDPDVKRWRVEGTASSFRCVGFRDEPEIAPNLDAASGSTAISGWLAKPADLRNLLTITSDKKIAPDSLKFVLREAGGSLPLLLFGNLLTRATEGLFLHSSQAPDEFDMEGSQTIEEEPLASLMMAEHYQANREKLRNLDPTDRQLIFLSEGKEDERTPFEWALATGFETTDSLAELFDVEPSSVVEWADLLARFRSEHNAMKVSKDFVGQLLQIEADSVPRKLRTAREKLAKELQDKREVTL